MMVVPNQTTRLQSMNVIVNLTHVPIYKDIRILTSLTFYRHLIPITIKPYSSNRTIIGKQLAQLVFHKLDVIFPITFHCTPRTLTCPACPPRIIVAAPIQNRIIQKKFHILFTALLGQLFQNIPFKMGIHYIKIGIPGIPKAETIVMTGNKRNILHPGPFGIRHPPGRIKIYRIKTFGKQRIILDLYVFIIHHPFAIPQQTEKSPVNKHTEFSIFEPFAGLHIRIGWCIGLNRRLRDNGRLRK